MEDNYLIVREYEERILDSKSSIHQNFIEFKHSNGLYYFALIKSGKVFMRSEGYSSASARDHGIHSVIKNCLDKNNYLTESAHGAYFLILLAANNKEIARSYPMREEIETFIALNDITSTDISTSHFIHEENKAINEVENNESITIISEEKESIDEVKKTEAIEIEEIQKDEEPPIPQNILDEPTKIISTPLLESFQKGLSDFEEKEEDDKKDAFLGLDDFELEDDDKIDNQTISETTSESSDESPLAIEENKPVDEFIEMKNKADQLYGEVNTKPKSELGKILEEESQNSNKRNWKWLLWLFLILLFGLLFWWLFQMKGLEKIKSLVGVNKSSNSSTSDSKNTKKVSDTLLLDQATLDAKATWEKTLGGMVAIRLPDGSLISVPENGTEKKLVEYLEAKCGTSEIKKTWFDMDRILFKTGTDELKEVSEEQIILIAKIFKSYPKKKFKIGGYTDNVGDPEANIRLSAIRAEAATRAIIAKEIDSARLRYEGYGQEHPICPANDTEECRAKNRRVAIRVDMCE